MREPSAYEQLLVELINRARLDPVGEASRYGISLDEGLSGGAISSEPKAPLAVSQLVDMAAYSHAVWMLETDTFSHKGDGGSSVGSRVSAEGYDWTRVGENISWVGTTGSLGDLSARIEQQHRNLFLSAGHRANMLREEYVEIGVAQAVGLFTSGGTTYNASMVVENFARPADGARFFTGVVIDDRDGDDFYDVGEGLGGVTVTATGSAGTFSTVSFASGGYSLEVPNGTYAVTFAGGALEGTITVEGVTMSGANVKIDAEQDDAAAAAEPGPAINVLYGTSTGEEIVGTHGNDEIWARGGDDLVRAAKGDDLIHGELGRDTLLGIDGDDEIYGGGGADSIHGGHGRDVIDGGDGNDLLAGAQDDDVVLGGPGNDKLRGDDGSDTLEGGAGDDRIAGGPGADRFLFRAGLDRDRITDFAPGVDMLDFSGHAGVAGFDDLRVVSGSDRTVIYDPGADRIVLLGVDPADFGAGDFVFA